MKRFFSLVLAVIAATTMVFATSQSDSKTVDCGTTVRLTATPVTGYHLVKWQNAGGDSITNAETLDVTASSPTSYKAVFAPNTNTAYQVKHFLQNLDGSTYPSSPEATDDLTGTTGATTAAEEKTYTGFTAQTVVQGTIAGDGSTVVRINYTRNKYELTWNVNGGNALSGTYTHGQVYYGATITKPADPTREGYVFVSWGTTPATTMPASNTTYTAQWTGAANTYTVKHWQQNLTGSEYTEVEGDRQVLSGNTGTTTAAEAKTYTGFTAQPFSQTTVAVGGTTVINIYYNRNMCTVAWSKGEGNELTGTYTTGSVRYGTTLVAPNTPTKNTVGSTVYTFYGWNNGTETLTTLPATVTADVTYTAVFSSTNQYTLTAASNNTGLGTVTGTGTYNSGTSVTMVATPISATCDEFLYWDDDHTNTNPERTVTVTATVTYTAVFQKKQYTITATTDDDSMGSVTVTQP